jgi:hypothetical protein
MRDGNVKAAKELFEKEVDRAAYYHEFHFWLALAYVRLGEVEPGAQAPDDGDGETARRARTTTSTQRSSTGSASRRSRSGGARQ